MSKMGRGLFTLVVLVFGWMGRLFSDVVSVAAVDIGTVAPYGPPHLPTKCRGYDQNQFPANGIFVAASKGIFAGGAACGQKFLIRCLNGLNVSCKNETIVATVVNECPTDPCPATLLVSKKGFDGLAESKVADATKFNMEYEAL